MIKISFFERNIFDETSIFVGRRNVLLITLRKIFLIDFPVKAEAIYKIKYIFHLH